MKTKRIYPKEWSEWHPYKKTTPVDSYYADLATDIYSYLTPIQAEQKLFETEEDTRRFCICLTAWFEDVISGTGIWQTFTSECKRLYRSYLPFYRLTKNYYPDEINLEDVCFLLWHHLQQTHTGCVFNPKNPYLCAVARELYQLLCDDYEVAPDNVQLQEYLDPDRDFRNFQDYYSLLHWFHYNCYFSAFNKNELEEEIKDILKDETLPLEHAEVLMITSETEISFKSRKGFLSYTSPQWIAKLFSDNAYVETLSNVKEEEFSYYKIVSEDNEYSYADDLCNDLKGLPILKKSLDRKHAPKVGQIISGSFVTYGNVLCQCGMLLPVNEGPTLRESIKRMKNESAAAKKAREDALIAYEEFMEATGGKPFVYFNSASELLKFTSGKLGYDWEVEIPFAMDRKVVLTATKERGLGLILECIECIKDPDNPFYNKKIADRDSMAFYIQPALAPFEVICVLKDKGFLPDAYLKVSDDKRTGLKLVNDNWDFIVSYFLKRCRENDL